MSCKKAFSIRFDDDQIDQAMTYLESLPESKTLNFSELVRVALSAYLRQKMIEKTETKRQWLGF